MPSRAYHKMTDDQSQTDTKLTNTNSAIKQLEVFNFSYLLEISADFIPANSLYIAKSTLRRWQSRNTLFTTKPEVHYLVHKTRNHPELSETSPHPYITFV